MPTLACQITNTGNKSFKDYLESRSVHTFEFKPINENKIMSISDNLHPKSSCVKDGLTTKVLKLIKTEISEAVTLINQSIATGIFSDKLKIAKVIPLV